MIRARLLMGRRQQQQWSQMEAWNWYHSSWKKQWHHCKDQQQQQLLWQIFHWNSQYHTSRRRVLLFAQQRTLSETKGADWGGKKKQKVGSVCMLVMWRCQNVFIINHGSSTYGKCWSLQHHDATFCCSGNCKVKRENNSSQTVVGIQQDNRSLLAEKGGSCKQFSKQLLVEGRRNLTTKGEDGGQQLLVAIGL
jgi:hypothetical protein